MGAPLWTGEHSCRAGMQIQRAAGYCGTAFLRRRPGDAPEAAGVPGVFGAVPALSRRVARVSPGLGGDLDAAGPPGWGGLGAVGGAFPPDAPALPPFVVTLV